MSKLTFNMTMSLDGFVAGPHDEVDQIFGWYFSGDTEMKFEGSDYVFKVSGASAERLRTETRKIGAVITGKRNFTLAGAWNGSPPLGVPHVVVTHNPVPEWQHDGSPFTFVTDGIESAVAKAKELAGGKDVTVSSPSIMRQCLQAGLLDEITIDLAAVLLGEGVRLFERMGIEPVQLEVTGVVQGQGVVHLSFRVLKQPQDMER